MGNSPSGMLTRWRERAAHHLMPLFLLNGMGHAKVYTLQSSRRDGACWLATYAAQAPREYQIVVRYPGDALPLDELLASGPYVHLDAGAEIVEQGAPQ